MAGITFRLLSSMRLLNCTGINSTLWTELLEGFAGGTFCSSKSLSNSACKSLSVKKNQHLWFWYRLNFCHCFPHLTYSQCCEQGFVRVSFKQSEFSRFCLSLILVWISKSVLSYVCLFLCKTKLRTLTEWTVSGPDAGIVITPVARRKRSYKMWYWYEGGDPKN